ncbi:MAG TPA: polysaccharide deacetylase family protein [Polyangia bacterium]|nr:polysaccharide deacetylase family protein [Polyangia bacterium]
MKREPNPMRPPNGHDNDNDDDDHRNDDFHDDALLQTASEHTRPHNELVPGDAGAPAPVEGLTSGWRLRDWVKLGLAATVEQTGIGGIGRTIRTFASGARVHVLGYHRVVDRIDGDGPVNPSLCITAPLFRRQMEQLRERFVVLPLSYVVRALSGEVELVHDAVAVTFDDGYRDVLLRAAPILSALEIPATVFVPTGFAEVGSPVARLLPHDRLYAGLWTARRDGVALGSLGDAGAGDDNHGETLAPLWAAAAPILADEGPAGAVEALIRAASASQLARIIAALEARLGPPALDDGAMVLQPDEVRALADRGWEIGAHTEGHVVLTHEPLPEVRRQLVTSKAALERWSGRRCRYFAYCNGYHSDALVAELKRAGYEGAVTTCDRPNDATGGDPFRISRKVLWEAHARGPDGHFSPSLSAANLHDLFGVLGLTHPVDGAMEQAGVTATTTTPTTASSSDGANDDETSNLPPTEVELAY